MYAYKVIDYFYFIFKMYYHDPVLLREVVVQHMKHKIATRVYNTRMYLLY